MDAKLLLLVFLVIAAARAAQTTSSNPVPTLAPQYAKKYLYECDDTEKLVEADAWKDHLKIAKEAKKWQPGKRWQPAFDMYMGTDSKTDPWKSAIKDALDNQVKVHSSNWIWPQSWIYVYCKEKDNKSPFDGKQRCDAATAAYSFVVTGWFHNSYNIVFCPKFYQEKLLIDNIVGNINGGHADKMNATYQWLAYGVTYYHEFMHQYGLVNKTEYEGGMHETYTPRACQNLAWYYGCKGKYYMNPRGKYWVSSMYNADSFAVAATVAYFQETLKLGSPARPLFASESEDEFTKELLGNGPDTFLGTLDATKDDVSYLPWNAKSKDWSYTGLNLTEANLPLLYPDSSITDAEYAELEAMENADDTVPGLNGVSGCAYALVADIGVNGAMCKADYCNCGGTPAPLLTFIVSLSTTTTNCNYPTQPASQCPPATIPSAPIPTPTSAVAPKPTSPYVAGPGPCSIQLTEIQAACLPDSENLSVIGAISDAGGNIIGSVPQTQAGATSPLHMKSKLESELVIVAEHQGDYVQFTLGGMQWTSSSNDAKSAAYCNTDSWNTDAICAPRGVITQERKIQCFFSCPYNGGKSSDGS